MKGILNVGEPLNIALIRRTIDPSGGGAEKVASRFVSEFARRGHRVTFIGEEVKNYPAGTFPASWLRIQKRGLAFSPTVRFHRQVARLTAARRGQFDLLYSMCRTYPVDVFRVTEQLHFEWVRRNYSPLAWLNPRHNGILNLEEQCFKPENVRYVAVNSRLVMRQMIDNYGFPPERLLVVCNGVDRTTFYPAEPEEKAALRRELGLPENKQILLFVAVDFRTKRLDMALEAAARLSTEQRRNLVLVAIGGDNPEPYRKQAQECGIEMIFPGRCNTMRKYYAAADLLYYPSPYEPFANVCLEAAACALPVLTTAVNGSCELVEHSRGGYVAAGAGSVDEIGACLNDFLQSPPEGRAEMGRTILAASQPYTWERHADLLEGLFYQVREEKCRLQV